MTATELSSKSGVSLPTISRLVNKRQGDVTSTTLFALAKALKVTPETLIADEAHFEQQLTISKSIRYITRLLQEEIVDDHCLPKQPESLPNTTSTD